jgi:hypothetical protein
MQEWNILTLICWPPGWKGMLFLLLIRIWDSNLRPMFFLPLKDHHNHLLPVISKLPVPTARPPPPPPSGFPDLPVPTLRTLSSMPRPTVRPSPYVILPVSTVRPSPSVAPPASTVPPPSVALSSSTLPAPIVAPPPAPSSFARPPPPTCPCGLTSTRTLSVLDHAPKRLGL